MTLIQVNSSKKSLIHGRHFYKYLKNKNKKIKGNM